MSHEERSYKIFEGLKPDFRERVIRWYEECKAEGLKLLVYCGYRSSEDQDNLYKIGRGDGKKIVTNARGGQSFHNYARAIDFVPVKDGQTAWDDTATYLKAQKIGKEFGLRALSWELPHLEDSNYADWHELARTSPHNEPKTLSSPILEPKKATGRGVGGRGLR